MATENRPICERPLTKDMEHFLIVGMKLYPNGHIPREGISYLPGNHKTWEGLEGRGLLKIGDESLRVLKRAQRRVNEIIQTRATAS